MNNFGVVEVASERRSVAPGWAYVPDTLAVARAGGGAIPGTPAGAEPGQQRGKRAARNLKGSALANFSDLSARQETKVRRELELLNRDSGAGIGGNREVIALPAKAVKAQNKHTPNVRKILASQKTFANHLDDFKALQEHNTGHGHHGGGHGHGAGDGGPTAHAAGGRAAAAAAAAAVSASANAAGGTRSGNSRNSRQPARKDARRSTAAAAAAANRKNSAASKKSGAVANSARGGGDTPMPDAPAAEASSAGADATNAGTQKNEEESRQPPVPQSAILRAYDGPRPPTHPLDAEPLLKSRMPPLPSDDELRALLATPPLTYTEAQAVWPPTGPDVLGASAPEKRYPTRVFCEICGYWGRVKCTKCGTPVCALDCLEVHREDCITRYGL